MNYWIIASDGNCYGPADDATMRRWISEGRVIAPTPVGPTKDGPWNEARSVPTLAALFPPTVPGAGEAHDPPPGSGGYASATAAAAAIPPTGPTVISTNLPAEWPPSTIAIAMLISGIFNLIAGLSWTLTCLGVLLGGPLIVLGIFELITYSGGRAMEPNRYLGRAKVMAILGVCTILTWNLGSFICGIIILTQLTSAREKLAQARA